MPRARTPKPTAGQLPRPFQLKHFPGDVAAGDSWGVRQGDRWRMAARLCCQVTITSDDGEIFTGVGVVSTLQRGDIVITA